MYQNGLVRVSPQADATGNIVGIAVTESVVIPSPEEICPETSRADGRGGHRSFHRLSYAVTVRHKRL